MGDSSRKTTGDTHRADNNREKQVTAIRRLSQLAAIAADPKFRGSFGVEISVVDGVFKSPKVTLIDYDQGD